MKHKNTPGGWELYFDDGFYNGKRIYNHPGIRVGDRVIVEYEDGDYYSGPGISGNTDEETIANANLLVNAVRMRDELEKLVVDIKEAGWHRSCYEEAENILKSVNSETFQQKACQLTESI